MAEGLGGVAAAAGAATTGAPGAADTGAGAAVKGALQPGATGNPTAGALKDAKPSGDQKPGEVKTWDVKINGKVTKMTEQQMIDAASLGTTAYQRMEEASRAKKQAESFMKELESDPMAAIDKLKLTADQKRKMLEEYYKKNYIDQDKLSPVEKELQEHKKWRAEQEQKEKDREVQQQEQQRQEAQGQWREHYSKVITDQIDKSGLPKTARTIGRMAFYLAKNNEMGLNQTIEQISERVKTDYREEFSTFASEEAPVETLIELLGPNAVRKIQKYTLELHKKKMAEGFNPPPPADATEIKPSMKKKPEVDPDGWKKVTRYWSRRDK